MPKTYWKHNPVFKSRNTTRREGTWSIALSFPGVQSFGLKLKQRHWPLVWLISHRGRIQYLKKLWYKDVGKSYQLVVVTFNYLFALVINYLKFQFSKTFSIYLSHFVNIVIFIGRFFNCFYKQSYNLIFFFFIFWKKGIQYISWICFRQPIVKSQDFLSGYCGLYSFYFFISPFLQALWFFMVRDLSIVPHAGWWYLFGCIILNLHNFPFNTYFNSQIKLSHTSIAYVYFYLILLY